MLDELAEIVSGKDNPEDAVQEKELKDEINRFLSGFSRDKRYMFVLRYWYADGIGEIAERFHMSENNVSVTLGRMRKKLKEYLTERGYRL